ncbi:hypothetical protein M0R45_008866 [Rubus argutus]|uniref:Uncharacterized protein n=1 Tax=Rubus argutus TaxID=59490 RepID=A0AAW1Y2Z6_RUBAR
MDGFDDDLGIQLSIDAVRWLWLGRGLNGGLREGYGDAGVGSSGLGLEAMASAERKAQAFRAGCKRQI